MADQRKLTENGVELGASVSIAVAEANAAAQAAAGAATLTVPAAATVVLLVVGLIRLMTDDDDGKTNEVLRALQQQINQLKSILTRVQHRLDVLVEFFVDESNRVTLRSLQDYLAEIEGHWEDMKDSSLDVAVTANKSGLTLDKFTHNDFDIWRWTDMVIDPRTRELVPARLKFKNLPTLPVYMAALLTWLAARERAVQMGQGERLTEDAARVDRHLKAVSVRADFDKYGSGDTSIPRSIAEHIKWNIRAFVLARDTHAINRVCRFAFDVQNWMNGERKSGDEFERIMDNDQALCTVDPTLLGAPRLELEAETEAGVELLHSLFQDLQHLATPAPDGRRVVRSLRKPFIGTFAPTDF